MKYEYKIPKYSRNKTSIFFHKVIIWMIFIWYPRRKSCSHDHVVIFVSKIFVFCRKCLSWKILFFWTIMGIFYVYQYDLVLGTIAFCNGVFSDVDVSHKIFDDEDQLDFGSKPTCFSRSKCNWVKRWIRNSAKLSMSWPHNKHLM